MNILAEMAERTIQEAQQRGEFEGLSGHGRPLPEAREPFMPETLRMAYKVLKNAGYVPKEIQDQREIRSLIECLEQETDESRKIRQIQKVQLYIARAKIAHGGLLQEENEKYFHKVVARVTLNKI